MKSIREREKDEEFCCMTATFSAAMLLLMALGWMAFGIVKARTEGRSVSDKPHTVQSAEKR